MTKPLSTSGLFDTHDLGDQWEQYDDPAAPQDTVQFVHTDGHRLGLRIQNGGATIQGWITAGRDLPPLPDAGTPEERATAQAANDARLQPGRTWHAAITTSTAGDLTKATRRLVQQRLLPALTRKPKVALTVSYGPASRRKPPARKTTTPRKKGAT